MILEVRGWNAIWRQATEIVDFIFHPMRMLLMVSYHIEELPSIRISHHKGPFAWNGHDKVWLMFWDVTDMCLGVSGWGRQAPHYIYEVNPRCASGCLFPNNLTRTLPKGIKGSWNIRTQTDIYTYFISKSISWEEGYNDLSTRSAADFVTMEKCYHV